MKISDIYMTLHRVRKERGLSQREVAEHLNVEQATISQYENFRRGIPLEILDRWLELLDIDVTITQREHQPVKGEEEMKDDLEAFARVKKRRNFLIAELRSFMARQIAKTSLFQKINEESGEGVFWSFSFFEDPSIGIVETRYDHPKQKYLAVEYSDREVNVYGVNRVEELTEMCNEPEDIAWLNAGRSYLTEDDFLTLGARWDRNSLDTRRITILRKSGHGAGETEIVNPEGFSLRSLLAMQETLEKLKQITRNGKEQVAYKEMEKELLAVNQELLEIVRDNRLANGALNPQFVTWDKRDQDAVDVPLWSSKRNWSWVEEGVRWKEDEDEGTIEIQAMKDELPHELFDTYQHENGNHIMGLSEPEKNPEHDL